MPDRFKEFKLGGTDVVTVDREMVTAVRRDHFEEVVAGGTRNYPAVLHLIGGETISTAEAYDKVRAWFSEE